MGFDASRLRAGEAIAGASAIVLLGLVFLTPWYGLAGGVHRVASAAGISGSVDGWHGLSTLRWLILVTIAAALALAWLQATRRAPALPVSLSVIVTVLGLLTVLALIYRVLIAVPGPGSLIEGKIGAYLGLVVAAALTFGAFRSLREETRRDGSEAVIPVVALPAD